MHSITSTPGALRLFAISVLARLPLPTLSIGLLVHARHLTGSFAAAGLVAGTYGAALGIGGPFLRRLLHPRGPTMVLIGSAGAPAALLGVIAVMAARTPGEAPPRARPDRRGRPLRRGRGGRGRRGREARQHRLGRPAARPVGRRIADRRRRRRPPRGRPARRLGARARARRAGLRPPPARR